MSVLLTVYRGDYYLEVAFNVQAKDDIERTITLDLAAQGIGVTHAFSKYFPIGTIRRGAKNGIPAIPL